ncbi:MAG: hypothetical protein LBH38_01515 [Holosporales bacterium]|jgi:hypothetical protein|nr:hypothetical protein [Holosporales bacterium]
MDTTRYLSLILAAVLSGCSTDVPLETVSLSASMEANSSYATVVDLIIVFDKDIAAKVSSMPASQYFPVSDQLQHDNAELMSRWRWEIIPGQIISKCPIIFSKCSTPLAAFIFARYYTPGDHRKKLTPVEDIAVLLEQEDFKVCELVEGKETHDAVKHAAAPLPKVSEEAFRRNAQTVMDDPIAQRRLRRERLRQRLKNQNNF